MKTGIVISILMLGVMLLIALVAYANFQFNQQARAERKQLLESAQSLAPQVVTEEAITHLPAVVQNWLRQSGAVGKAAISTVYLTQSLQLKMQKDQKNWIAATADQYFSVQPPAFHWSTEMWMKGLIKVVGRDQFTGGEGQMLIKLFSLIPVVNAKDNEKINQATLQRYLAEIVWFPTAAISPHIRWEAIDERSARATLLFQGTEGSGVFHFDESGDFSRFTAMRYQGESAVAPTLWTVTATKVEAHHGLRIPTECEAKWQLEEGDWTWLKLKVIDVRYHTESLSGRTKSEAFSNHATHPKKRRIH